MTARTSAVGLEPPSESGDPAGRYHEQTRTRPLRRRFALLPARRGARRECVLLQVVVDRRPARQWGPRAMGMASSVKKDAPAARPGGRGSSGQPRSLLVPATLTVVAVLRVSLVV